MRKTVTPGNTILSGMLSYDVSEIEYSSKSPFVQDRERLYTPVLHNCDHLPLTLAIGCSLYTFIAVTKEVNVCNYVSVQSLPRVMPRHFVFITDLVCLSAWTTRYASLRINSNFDMRKVVRSVNHLFAFKHQPS